MENIAKEQITLAGNTLQHWCHKASKDAGWWNKGFEPLTFSNKLMLIVSEVAEAMEGDRKSLRDDKLTHRDMREVELADAVIRIFDLAGAYNMDLGGAITEKMQFNETRADHTLAARTAEGGKAY